MHKYKQNNFKIICFLIIFITLFSFCIIGLQNPQKYTYFLVPSSKLVAILSIIGIIILPYISTHFIIWLFQKKNGLELNKEGIYNRTYYLKIKFIPWKEIKNISVSDKNTEKRIKILVKEPLKYLEGSDFLTKLFMKIQIKSSGTPIYINSFFLKVSKKELFEILIKKWEKHK